MSASRRPQAIADPWRRRVEGLLAGAGLRIGGERPQDPQVHDPRFFRRVMAGGSLALGESYMDGWWDAESLDGFFAAILSARLDRRMRRWGDLWLALRAWLLNLQTPRRAREVGRRHYDLGNDLYRAMLGRHMVYSCGYWADADNLDDAQAAKLDLCFRKLGLAPGMRLLDIGCGFGEALARAAERHGVEGVGITISEQQAAYARERCAGLPVEIRVQDYREAGGRFDRVLSIGMFEHVGRRNYRRFFDKVRQLLAPDGLFLLHTIGGELSTGHTDPWIGRYIFPNSMLPSAVQIARATEGRFVIEDWHNFGADYDLTLQAWRRNFDAAWPRLAPRYGERFRRMWHYYLAVSMASFRTRRNQLWQVLLSPGGVPGGWRLQR
ncbi:cyclopropane fatty acyl phospholipid synthase [Arenimonas fontis]|uniref:Cyclopropane fatty acyl phospholipid synthase n=1 Tax=Arenimonas fontis TaxID=2608255 RepID=A0A5B2ZBV5_9GAMM|nr:cyclopropane fatty acyl phospholipid synthase [Arenimonas fontis]KAA2284622.1 cyclopropane fatty acyl phospholipid synthase [Arenimonas fontis]